MVRWHAMELVARYGARMRGSIWASCAMGRGVSLQSIWARGKPGELVRVKEDRSEAIDEQRSRTHIKIGPGAMAAKRNETRSMKSRYRTRWRDRQA
jgi:hypothetical protein